MKRVALLLSVAAALLPAWTVTAAPPPPPVSNQSIANFNCAPGTQTPGHPQRAFIYTLRQGQSVADKVAVVNTSRTSPLTVRLSISDGLTSPQGGGLAFNDTRTQRQIGRWVRLSVTTVTVPRYSITFVPMTVSLPSSVPPGQYEGAVNVTDVRATTISSGKAKFGVYLNRRCMVLLRASGPPRVGLKVTHVGVARAAARTVLGLQLQNTGTVLDYPVATVLTVVGHGRTYTLHPGVGLVTGGMSTALAVPLDRAIAPGRYQVRVQLTYLVRPSPSESAQSYTLRWQGTVSVPQGKGH